MMTSWREIAQYLGKSVRTVQRWEAEFGLPVRRHGDTLAKGFVVAIPTEIDAWIQKRYSPRHSSVEFDIESPSSSADELTRLRRENEGLRGRLKAYEPGGTGVASNSEQIRCLALIVKSTQLQRQTLLLQQRLAENWAELQLIRAVRQASLPPPNTSPSPVKRSLMR